jgi:hypothetical protein
MGGRRRRPPMVAEQAADLVLGRRICRWSVKNILFDR